MSRIRLGDMLVQAQMVGPEQIDEALALQRERAGTGGARLGELLVELGYVSEMQLAQVLSNQLSVPWVNLYHVDFSRELLNLISAESAEKYRCVPVYVRKVRKQGDTLFVATDDPTNESTLIAIAQQVGMPVKPMVASSSDVRNAIRVYYFGGRESAVPAPVVPKKRATSIAPPPAALSIPPVELDDTDLEDEGAAPEVSIPKAPPTPAEGVAPVVRAPAGAAASVAEKTAPESGASRESAAKEEPAPAAASAPAERPRRPRKQSKGRMITLTLLDGTTVSLPQPGASEGAAEQPEEGLTTRDLIAALQARAEGKDVSTVLPDARWEPLFAALLSLLLRKGLIADWEFVDEWRKHRR